MFEELDGRGLEEYICTKCLGHRRVVHLYSNLKEREHIRNAKGF